jgi:hypothetical protein
MRKKLKPLRRENRQENREEEAGKDGNDDNDEAEEEATEAEEAEVTLKTKRKRRKKLKPLRRENRQENREEEPGEQLKASPHPPIDAKQVFDIALCQHEAENRIQESTYDDYDYDGNDDNDDKDGNDDNDEAEEEAEDAEEAEDEQERLARFTDIMEPFAIHLKSREGGEKPEVSVVLSTKRVIALLNGTFSSRHSPALLNATKVAVHAWILRLIDEEYSHISKFLDDLGRRRGLRPNTIKAYLTSSYIPFFIWHRLFSMVVPQPLPDSHARLHLVLKSLVANYRKSAKNTKRAETKTVEELIATKQWPKGGMTELRAAFLDHQPLILEAFNGVEPYKHNIEFFRDFMAQLLFGELSFSP